MGGALGQRPCEPWLIEGCWCLPCLLRENQWFKKAIFLGRVHYGGGVYRLTIAILQGMKYLWISTVFPFWMVRILNLGERFSNTVEFSNMPNQQHETNMCNLSMCFFHSQSLISEWRGLFFYFLRESHPTRIHDHSFKAKNMWNSDFIWACDLKIPTPKSIGSSLYLESFGLTLLGVGKSSATEPLFLFLTWSLAHPIAQRNWSSHCMWGAIWTRPQFRCQVCANICWWLYWMLGKLQTKSILLMEEIRQFSYGFTTWYEESLYFGKLHGISLWSHRAPVIFFVGSFGSQGIFVPRSPKPNQAVFGWSPLIFAG